MRGKRAKILRKVIYGDQYSGDHNRTYITLETGQVVTAGIRRIYQQSKKHLPSTFGINLRKLHREGWQKSKLETEEL